MFKKLWRVQTEECWASPAMRKNKIWKETRSQKNITFEGKSLQEVIFKIFENGHGGGHFWKTFDCLVY